jgi:N-acetylglucosamine malate deacetylase 1
VSRAKPTPGHTPGPGSMMLVMAHADDAELWAGGTIAVHSPAGATIALGRGEPQRMTEAAGGARALGAQLRVLDQLTPDTLAALLLELRPQVLITHRIDDVHPDHRHAAQTTLAALPKAVIATGHPLRVYTCDSYESLTLGGQVPGTVVVDVTSTFPVKMRALAAHQSQPLDHFGPMAERLGRSWGARIGTDYGEAFDPVPVLGRVPGHRHL